MGYKRWQIIAGIALLAASTLASALSLGRVRGTPVLGRNLDLSIQATLDAQEALPEASCLSAELFYGETRVSPNALSLSPERTSGGESRIRVRANATVDEPVVTLFVRSTCGGSVSRRYVLLTEALTEAEPTGAPAVSSAITPQAPSATPRIAFGGVPAPSIAGGAEGASGSAAARRAERAAKRQAQREARQQKQEQGGTLDKERPLAVKPRTVESASVVRKSAAPSTPRLKIDLLDVAAAEPILRNSAELISTPASDEAVRRQAQALWRMLNASPEEAMREAQRLEGTEAQLRKAQEQAKRQGQDIATLNTQLQEAERTRYLNPFTIALGLLTLAALAASLYFWRRSARSGQPWWGGSAAKAAPKDEQHLWKHLGETPDSAVQTLQPLPKASGFNLNQTSPGLAARESSASDALNRTGSFASSASQSAPRFGEKPSGFQDSRPPANLRGAPVVKASTTAAMSSLRSGSMSPVDSTPPASFMEPVAKGKPSNSGFANSDFAPSMYNSPRVVAAEELFDIQEQADFFLSLGQPDQAIEVLKNHITDNVETSALAYMDLFDIYHRTNRKPDYNELREEFNRVFNAQVPEFSKYGAQSNGLEDFPQVLGSIQAAWNRPHQAQDVIEESIFRQPEQDQTLDMAAYRELMLLYALAKELSRPDAAYSTLPISAQVPVLPAGGISNTPDVDLGDGLMLSSPTESMIDILAADDRTMSLPHPLIKPNTIAIPAAAKDDGSLDFDLSDSAALSVIKKIPNVPKKS